jgi:hypothetical protein
LSPVQQTQEQQRSILDQSPWMITPFETTGWRTWTNLAA